jgi:thioredoxin 1
LIDFWASWCAPCLRFAPTYERVSDRHPDIVFAKVDTEAEQRLAMEFRITSIPTIMAIRDGIVVFRQAGALPERMLETLIEQVRALDMDDVKAQAA